MEHSSHRKFDNEAGEMAGSYPSPAMSWPFDPKAQIQPICDIIVDRVNHDMPRTLNYILAEWFPESLDNYIFGFTAGAIKKILQMVSREVLPTSQFAADVQMTGDVGLSISAAGNDFLCTICEDLSRAIIGALEEPVIDTCLVYIDEAFSAIACGVVGEYYPRHEVEQIYEALASDCDVKDSLCTAFSYAVADNVQKAYFVVVSDALDEAIFSATSSFHGLLSPGAVSDILAGRIRRSLAEAIGALEDGTIRASQSAACQVLTNGVPYRLCDTLRPEFDDGPSNADGLVAWCGEKMDGLALFEAEGEGNVEDKMLCDGDEAIDKHHDEYDYLVLK